MWGFGAIKNHPDQIIDQWAFHFFTLIAPTERLQAPCPMWVIDTGFSGGAIRETVVSYDLCMVWGKGQLLCMN
jgi:hypothetical protein